MNVTYIGFGYSEDYQRSLDGMYCLFNGEWYVYPRETLKDAERATQAIIREDKQQYHIALMVYDEETHMAVPKLLYTAGG